MGYHTFSENSAVIPPAKEKQNCMFVFDDIASEKQDYIRAYFSTGRHCDVESFNLGQSYTRIPKHLIRDNASF